ncbi:hypothetical protein [Campylobacter sp. MIT 97-5078]|nr:hypothetical protein [Campylobacter sp. MIT 97-5078]
MIKIIFLSVIMLASIVFVSCAGKQPDRNIDYTSPCACYEIEKITKVGA